MEVIKYTDWGAGVPLKFTGIIHWPDGEIEYFLNGKTHRVDGPAVTGPHGECWMLNDKAYSTKEEWFNALTSKQQFNALWSVDLWK